MQLDQFLDNEPSSTRSLETFSALCNSISFDNELSSTRSSETFITSRSLASDHER